MNWTTRKNWTITTIASLQKVSTRARTLAKASRAAVCRCITEPLEGRMMLSKTIYVDVNAPGVTHDGSAWATAYVDLQQGLSAATWGSGDRILVADGTYKPTTTADRDRSFTLKTGVSLEGGYAGASNPTAGRDVARYVTILSGDIGTVGKTSDNSYHVVVGSGIAATAIFDGFTISGGNANGTVSPDTFGAGMYNESGSPTIRNCIFSRNSAYGWDNVTSGAGAGVFNGSSSSPALTNCTFTGNSISGASGAGGGMCNIASSSPKLTDCTFSGNSIVASEGPGGGMCNISSSPTLINCTFSGNSTPCGGGGMENYSSSSPSLTNCTFVGNLANFGGGMYNESSSPALTNCTFSSNTTSAMGGMGGGMCNMLSSPTLTNCTISANTASGSYSEGGGMFNGLSSPTLFNCIVWGNTAAREPEISPSSSTANITHSDIQEGWAGSANIDADPLFVRNPSPGADGNWGTADDDYGDLRLRSGSPCLNAGSNAAVPAGITTDLAGNTRIQNATVDMGAYEFGNVALPTVSINDVAVQEGNAGTTNMVFTVTLSAASSQGVSVHYATADDTASTSSDYLAASGDISFAPGEISETIQVSVKGDTIVELNKTLNVNLSSPSNATIADGQGIGTIIDDDVAVVAKVPQVTVAMVAPAMVITSGQSAAVSFGSARVGAAGTSKVFRVTNTGTANLTLGKLSIPAGYQLVDGLVSMLAPGKSDTFTLKLLTKKAGKSAGLVSFANNFAGNTPFRFSITGTVTAGKAQLRGPVPQQDDVLIQQDASTGQPFIGFSRVLVKCVAQNAEIAAILGDLR